LQEKNNLTDYQRLKADPKEEGISWWEAPGVRWGKYKRLMIDSVEVRIIKAEREMKPKEMEKLAGTLRNSVVEAIRPRYPVVNRPGPDVLRIRAALTHLKPVSPAGNVIAVAVLMMPIDVGESAVEVQFIDSVSGKNPLGIDGLPKRESSGCDRGLDPLVPGGTGIQGVGPETQGRNG
jgi:hypothetical protein